MKKIICFLLIFIILLSPLHIVKASEAITLTQGSIELLNNGIDFLSYSGGVPYGFLPFVFSSEKNYQNVVEDMMQKEDVFIIDGNANIQIRPLTQIEYGLLENAYFYDDEGNIVSLQELYYGEADNGYFTEKFYCKNDGSIVFQDSNSENPYIDVKFGGSELSYLDWQNAYNTLSNDLSSNQYHYSLDGSSVGDVTYYASMGTNAGGRPYSASSLFIANQYQPGIIIPHERAGIIRNWYCNDLSAVSYTILLGSPGDYFVSEGNYTIGNYNYRYYISYLSNVNLNAADMGSYEYWLQNGGNARVFAKTGYTYNANLLNENVVSYQKIQANDDSIDFTNSYTYDSLEQYIDTLKGIQTYPNSDFDYTTSISDINYPYVYEIDVAFPDVAIPFPDSVVIDDTPAIDYPLEETIDPSLITSNIPIISDLKNKFPFSIPWDIGNLLKGLEAQRTTPYIDTDVTIPGINYTWHIEYDLSDFDGTAELFRTLFLIAFIIGLAYFSYDHFFGS